MSQVRNIVTNRLINRENAVMSECMGGFIHINVAQRIAKAIEIDETAYFNPFRITNDYATSDFIESNKVLVHFIAKSPRLSYTATSQVCLTGIDLSAFNTFMLEGKLVHTNIECTNEEIPAVLMKEVSILQYGDGRTNDILTFKQFSAMSNRPTSVGSSDAELRIVGTETICRFKFNEIGIISDVYSNRRITINGERIEVNIEYNSDSYRAYQSHENNRFGSGNRSGIFGYHCSGNHRSQYDAHMEDGKWYFGIEAEKQDSLAQEYASYLGGKCGQWGAERDSSLGRGGAEFISPILPLHNGSLVRKNFQQHRWMLDAQLNDNGNSDRTRCGGHMTISKKGMNGRELLTHLHHFVPMFYSLYIGRLNTNYGGAVTKSDVAHSRRAFSVKSFGVEIRIFSGVPSMEGAWWRVQLLQVITDMIDSGEIQSYKDVANAMVTDKHPLRKVMRKMYDSKRIRDKFFLVLSLGNMYENNGSSTIDLSGTSNDVKHKSDRIVTAFNEFRNVRSCTHRLWGVDSITTTEG